MVALLKEQQEDGMTQHLKKVVHLGQMMLKASVVDLQEVKEVEIKEVGIVTKDQEKRTREVVVEEVVEEELVVATVDGVEVI